MFDDLHTACPNCSSLRFSLDDLDRQRAVRCSRGCQVRLQDSRGGAAEAAKSARDLEKSLKRLNRTIEIQF